MTSIRLPQEDGTITVYETGEPHSFQKPRAKLNSRRPFAAVHVVADPLADNNSVSPARLDWDATLAFRRHLWSWGMSVADAMDTAQRGMGLDWEATRELIVRSTAEAKSVGGDIACGANTDQLPDGPAEIGRIIDAYLEQVTLIEESGGQAVMMASRNLAATATGLEDYQHVYRAVLSQATKPVVVHWLGEMFDPLLAGYWGGADLDTASDGFIAILNENAAAVDGVKISLLEKEREVVLRRRLPTGLRMYTGDDFNFPELIAGDGEHHSDAFLGAFDILAPAASAAIQALDAGEPDQFSKILSPTVSLARHVFAAPTFYYKTGVVFMAYLNGHQGHFRMVNGQEVSRSVVHLSRQFTLADQAGLLEDPELAVHRMALVLELAGIAQS
jgi:hypothetical protein